MMGSIVLVVGTKPEIIKIAPIINEANIHDLQNCIIMDQNHSS